MARTQLAAFFNIPSKVGGLMVTETGLSHTSQPGCHALTRNQVSSGIMMILGVAILVGVLTSSTALGSHLKSSPVSPPFPQAKRTEEPQASLLSPARDHPALSSSSTTKSIPASSIREPKVVPPVFTPNKENSQSHVRLGWRFLLDGRPQAAMAAYRQALRNNPKSASAFLGLGITLKSVGSLKTAKKALIQAVNIDPRLPSALVHLGYLYVDGHFGKSDPQTARRLFSQASKLGDLFADIALLDLQTRKIL